MRIDEIKQTRGIVGNILDRKDSLYNKDEWITFSNVLDDFIKHKTKSKYYANVNPSKVHQNPGAQIRSETIDPQHLQKLKGSIVSHGEVLEPLFLVQDIYGGFGILNGNHRDQATKELMASGGLPENYKYHAVIINQVLYAELSSILPLIQGIFNENTPKKENKNEDRVKSIRSYIDANDIDITSEKEYKKLCSLVRILYPHITAKGSKNIVTRARDYKLEERSDIIQRSTTKWTTSISSIFDLQYMGTIKNIYKDDVMEKNGSPYKEYKGSFGGIPFDGLIEVISNKGSSFDQKWLRDLRFRHRTKNGYKIIHLLIVQETKGKVEVVVNVRRAIINSIHETWKMLGTANGITFDYLVMAPQFESDCTIQLEKDGEKIPIKAENPDRKNDWRIISKKELLNQFDRYEKGKDLRCYKEEWLYTRCRDEEK